MNSDKFDIRLMPPMFSSWEPKKAREKQIAVLMSGGVDSSVTANILREDRWEVLGITMNIPVPCGVKSKGCCGADAAFVCNELDIPHYFIDVTEAFQKLIIERFRQSYTKGQTPNPCVDCNTFLKFSLVWDFLQEKLGIDYLATGHYAQVAKVDGQMRLSRAKDATKDQSYFLYGIKRERLKNLILPLGKLTKRQVRAKAAEINLSVADKPESMELCFAGEGDYRSALTDDQTDQQGDLTDMHGNKIGTHKGVANYTLGQRHGLGFAGGKPLYVGKIDAEANTVALGTRDQVSSEIIRANQINVLIPEEFAAGRRMFGKIRSYGQPLPCELIEVGQNDITARFDKPLFAPCPGQKLVLYNDSDNIIAGGTIFS